MKPETSFCSDDRVADKPFCNRFDEGETLKKSFGMPSRVKSELYSQQFQALPNRFQH